MKGTRREEKGPEGVFAARKTSNGANTKGKKLTKKSVASRNGQGDRHDSKKPGEGRKRYC